MKPRKPRSNGTSNKAKPEASLVDQLSEPLRDFVADFKLHGKSVLEQVRQESPSKYLEMASKLAALVAALRPEPGGFAQANSMQDIGRKLLQSVGADDVTLTDDMIAPVACNDAFIAKLEAIRDAAAQDGTTETNGPTLYEAATNPANRYLCPSPFGTPPKKNGI
jgi:hypothetical protein